MEKFASGLKVRRAYASLRAPPRISKITRNLSFTWRDKDVKNIVATNKLSVFTKVQSGASTIPIKVFVQSRDSWTLTQRGWKIRQSVELQRQAWANGKRIR